MRYDWSKEKLESTVKSANCWMVWLRLLGIPTRGRNYKTLKSKVLLYGIDVSHFNSEYARTHNGRRILKNRLNEEIFNDYTPIKTASVKKAYIERMLDIAHCEQCGITEWNGKDIVFQLHHKDGNHKNNKLENLILLCPNCHSQTENYANKNKKLETESIAVRNVNAT